jgi:hypothetical protein
MPLRAGFDDQLAVVAADGESQEVESVVEVDDPRLVLIEGKTSGRQPKSKLRLDLFGFLPGMAEHHHVIGVSDQRGRASFGSPCVTAFLADSGRFLQPMQRDVQQQRTDHPALRSSLLGRRESLARFEHARPQPVPDHSPAGKRSDRGKQPVMVDPVERGAEVRVQHPQAFRGLAAGHHVDH